MNEQDESKSVAVRDSYIASASLIRFQESGQVARVAPLSPEDAWKRYCESRLSHFEMAK
jgi:hypothetical protein